MPQWVAGDQSKTLLVRWLAGHINIDQTNIFFLFLLLQPKRLRLLLHGHIRQILKMNGNFVLHRGWPWRWRKEHAHPCPKNSLRIFFYVLWAVCHFLFVQNYFTYLSAFSYFLVEKVCLCFSEHQKLVFLLLTFLTKEDNFVIHSSEHIAQLKKLFCRLLFWLHSSVDEIIFVIYYSDLVPQWMKHFFYRHLSQTQHSKKLISVLGGHGVTWYVLTIKQMARNMTMTLLDTSTGVSGPDPWHSGSQDTVQFLLCNNLEPRPLSLRSARPSWNCVAAKSCTWPYRIKLIIRAGIDLLPNYCLGS